MKKRPGVGLAVIVIKDGKVLLGKRKNSYGDGTYNFPGGHLEFLEDFDDCAKRETKEETGLEVELIDNSPIAITNDFLKDDGKHYVTLFMKARYLGGEPKIMKSDKCEGWGWYSWENLPRPLFKPVENLIKQNYNPF